MLSCELGIPLYDNEVLVRASQRSGAAMDVIAAYDERISAEMNAFLPDRVDSRTTGDKLFKLVTNVIQDLGASGPCIIEGRLSDWILRDNPNRIAVLVTAPLDARVEIVRRKRGMTEKEAKKLVKRMQKSRELFYKRYSDGKCLMHENRAAWTSSLRRTGPRRRRSRPRARRRGGRRRGLSGCDRFSWPVIAASTGNHPFAAGC